MAGEDDDLLLRFDIVDDPAIRALEQVSDASVKASERAAAAAEKAALRASERAQDAALAAQKASERAARAAARAVEDGSAAAKRAAANAAEASEKAAKRAERANRDAAEKMASAWEKADHARQLALRRTQLAGGGGATGGTSLGDISKQLNQNQLVSDLEQVSAIFIQFGGIVSRVASITTSLIRPLALVGTVASASAAAMTVLAGAALALAGPFALGATIKAMFSMADAAVEARKRLKDLGVTIDKDTIQALDAYTAAKGRASKALDEFTVSVGGAAAARLVLLNEHLGEGAAKADGFDASIGRVALALGTAGLSEALIRANGLISDYADEAVDAADKTITWTDALNKHIDKQRELFDRQKALLGPLEHSTKWTRAQADAERKAAEAARDRARLLEDVERELSQLAEMQRTAMLAENERALKAVEAAEKTRQANRSFAKSVYDLQAASRAMGEAGEAAYAKLSEASDKYFKSLEYAAQVASQRIQEVGAAVDVVSQVFGPYADMIGTLFDIATQRAEAAHGVVEGFHNRLSKLRDQQNEAESKAAKERIQREIDVQTAGVRAAKAAQDQARKNQLKLWNLDKAAKISQAVMAGFLAVAQTFAQLGPVAGAIALPGVIGATGAAVASIAKQKPPSFHVGGRFGSRDPGMGADEMDVRVLRGEGAVTPRGMRALGDDGLAAVNAGVPITANITIPVYLDSREIGRHVATQQVSGKPKGGGSRNIWAGRGSSR